MYEPSEPARIIEDHRRAEGVSVRSAAKKASLSEGRWRQIAKGYQQATKEVRVPVHAPVETLVKMALALHMNTYHFDPYGFRYKGNPEMIEFMEALSAAIPKSPDSPMFGGSYEDPDYIGSVEEWVSELQTRIEMLEDRLGRLEPDIDDSPDYPQTSERDARGQDLPKQQGQAGTGHDEAPHES